MKIVDLLKDLKYELLAGNTDREIGSICYDSRKCDKNSLFVALKGTQNDGHKYISELISKGIAAIIYEEIITNPMNVLTDKSSNLKAPTIIKVENSRRALAQVSKNWYKNPLKDIKVIGVTGTNGKTTITYLLKAIFDKLGHKTGIIGTTGIYTGKDLEVATHTTPESLELFGIIDKMKTFGVEYIFMEVSSHSLHQSRVASIDFDTAIFTNLTHDHLDYHKTIDEYASAKKILFNMLNVTGKAIVNGDDAYGNFMLSDIKSDTNIKVGRGEQNDYRIENETLGLSQMDFVMNINDKKEKFISPMLGRFNIDNCALAISCALQYKIPLEIIKSAIASSIGAPGRMQRVKLKNNAIGIVDYSHTPDALEKALLTCRELLLSSVCESKLFCVFGCGGDRDKAKRPLMGKIATNIADFTILTDDNPRSEKPEVIINDILTGISNDKMKNVEIIPDRKEAIKFAINKSKENDIILIAGKGHENYQIYGTNKNHFDDVEELSFFANLFDSFIPATSFLT